MLKYWAGATRPSIPSNLGWGNDLQLLEAEGLRVDGTFRPGLELRQAARDPPHTHPHTHTPNINELSTLHNETSDSEPCTVPLTNVGLASSMRPFLLMGIVRLGYSSGVTLELTCDCFLECSQPFWDVFRTE